MSFWGEAVPNWIAAVSTFFALIAAAIAARFAGKAAISTAEQAESARLQVDQVERQLVLTQEELARADTDAKKTQRSMAETRLDAIAPEVTANVYPEQVMITCYNESSEVDWCSGPDAQNWNIANADFHSWRLMFALNIKFQNVSNRTARVIVDDVHGTITESTLRGELILQPRGSDFASFVVGAWQYQQSIPALVSGANGPEFPAAVMRISFSVRDLNSSICDRYEIAVGLGAYLRRNDTYLMVIPNPPIGWRPTHGRFVRREYEALDRS